MEIKMESIDAWNKWWFEIEKYFFRCERFDSELIHHPELKPIMELWVKTAFEIGWKSAKNSHIDQ